MLDGQKQDSCQLSGNQTKEWTGRDTRSASSLWLYLNREKRYAATTAVALGRATHAPALRLGWRLLIAVSPFFLNTCPAQRCTTSQGGAAAAYCIP